MFPKWFLPTVVSELYDQYDLEWERSRFSSFGWTNKFRQGYDHDEDWYFTYESDYPGLHECPSIGTYRDLFESVTVAVGDMERFRRLERYPETKHEVPEVEVDTDTIVGASLDEYGVLSDFKYQEYVVAVNVGVKPARDCVYSISDEKAVELLTSGKGVAINKETLMSSDLVTALNNLPQEYLRNLVRHGMQKDCNTKVSAKGCLGIELQKGDWIRPARAGAIGFDFSTDKVVCSLSTEADTMRDYSAYYWCKRTEVLKAYLTNGFDELPPADTVIKDLDELVERVDKYIGNDTEYDLLDEEEVDAVLLTKTALTNPTIGDILLPKLSDAAVKAIKDGTGVFTYTAHIVEDQLIKQPRPSVVETKPATKGQVGWAVQDTSLVWGRLRETDLLFIKREKQPMNFLDRLFKANKNAAVTAGKVTAGKAASKLVYTAIDKALPFKFKAAWRYQPEISQVVSTQAAAALILHQFKDDPRATVVAESMLAGTTIGLFDQLGITDKITNLLENNNES